GAGPRGGSVDPDPGAGGGAGDHVADLAAGVEQHLELVEAAQPEAPDVRVQVRVLAAHRVAQRHQHLFAGHAAGDPRALDGLADLRRERGGPGARGLGHDVAVREGLVVEVAAVVVADLLALAVDQHLDPVAPVAGGLHRGAEGDDALAVLGVVAVADPAAVGAHVAAEVTFRGRGPDGRGGGAG